MRWLATSNSAAAMWWSLIEASIARGRLPVRIRVDVVRMSARRNGRATLEAHWRIVDPAAKTDEIGGDVFSAPIEGAAYSAVAQAFSVCLASLADRLVAKLPAARAG